MKIRLGKHGFKIVPKDKKLLRIKRVRQYLETVEDMIAIEFKKNHELFVKTVFKNLDESRIYGEWFSLND